MDFTENPDHRVIREAVRETCARFPMSTGPNSTTPARSPGSSTRLWPWAAGSAWPSRPSSAEGRRDHRGLDRAGGGFQAADAALQTHGGFGYAKEYHVARYWREARLLKIAPVPQEMVLNYLAEHVLGLPRSY